MSKEVDVAGYKYRIGAIPARNQFHVARKVAPMMRAMAAGALAPKAAGAPTEGPSAWLAMFAPLVDMISSMPHADADFIIDECLRVAERWDEKASRFCQVMANNGRFLYADITMEVMMRLTIETLEENLGSFFPMGGNDSQQEGSTEELPS